MIERVRLPKRVARLVPKRIAGIKVPANLRQGPVRSFLASSRGRWLIAEAIVVAGGALLARWARANRALT